MTPVPARAQATARAAILGRLAIPRAKAMARARKATDTARMVMMNPSAAMAGAPTITKARKTPLKAKVAAASGVAKAPALHKAGRLTRASRFYAPGSSKALAAASRVGVPVKLAHAFVLARC